MLNGVPSLKFSDSPASPEELSPRSEEFREAPALVYSIFPAPKLNSQLANMPNRTVPSQERKNPLLSKPTDYDMQIRTQEQELIALTNIQSKLSSKLQILQKEFETVKDVPALMKEKDKKIKELEIALETAQKEKVLEGQSGKGVMAFEAFGQNRPARVWRAEKEVKDLVEMKEKVLKIIRERMKFNRE